jgi:hypothetical protein
MHGAIHLFFHTVSGVVLKYKDNFTLCMYFLTCYSHMSFLHQYSDCCEKIWYVAGNVELACPAVWLLSFFFCLSSLRVRTQHGAEEAQFVMQFVT